MYRYCSSNCEQCRSKMSYCFETSEQCQLMRESLGTRRAASENFGHRSSVAERYRTLRYRSERLERYVCVTLDRHPLGFLLSSCVVQL